MTRSVALKWSRSVSVGQRQETAVVLTGGVPSELGSNMYLKAACADIAVPRLRGGPRPDLLAGSFQQRQGPGARLYPSVPGGWCRVACRPGGQQSLEELFVPNSPWAQQARRGMVYR